MFMMTCVCDGILHFCQSFSLYWNVFFSFFLFPLNRFFVVVVSFLKCCCCCSEWILSVGWCFFFYSWAAYLRVQVTSPTVMVATNSLSLNSRIMVDGGVPSCLWMNLLPSNVTVLLTLRPSNVSSSNSSPNLNVMVDVLNVDDVTKVYWSPSFFNSTVGVVEFPILRRTNPTPAQKIKEKKEKNAFSHALANNV